MDGLSDSVAALASSAVPVEGDHELLRKSFELNAAARGSGFYMVHTIDMPARLKSDNAPSDVPAKDARSI